MLRPFRPRKTPGDGSADGLETTMDADHAGLTTMGWFGWGKLCHWNKKDIDVMKIENYNSSSIRGNATKTGWVQGEFSLFNLEALSQKEKWDGNKCKQYYITSLQPLLTTSSNRKSVEHNILVHYQPLVATINSNLSDIAPPVWPWTSSRAHPWAAKEVHWCGSILSWLAHHGYKWLMVG